jgi:hypothetical protein
LTFKKNPLTFVSKSKTIDMKYKILERKQVGKYIAEICKLPEGARFPFSLLLSFETPRARWNKRKYVSHVGKPSLEAARQDAEKWLGEMAEKLGRRKAMNTPANAADFFQVGDILVESGGYEQTNVEFYEVVEVLPKTIKAQKIKQKVVEGSGFGKGFMSCTVMPEKGGFVSEKPVAFRVKNGGHLSQKSGFYYTKKWEGLPAYKSWYG